MAKTIKDKHEKIRKTYSKAQENYVLGKITRKEFVRKYTNLRKIAERRMNTMYELGMESPQLQNLGALSYQYGFTTHIPAFSKTDNPEKVYELMYEFVSSPYSTPEDWQAQEKIVEDLLTGKKSKSGKKSSMGWEKYTRKVAFINVIMEGHFWRLKKIFGSSPEAFQELDELLELGLTSDDVIEALDLYEAGSLGFDMVVEAILDRKEEYRMKKEGFYEKMRDL